MRRSSNPADAGITNSRAASRGSHGWSRDQLARQVEIEIVEVHQRNLAEMARQHVFVNR